MKKKFQYIIETAFRGMFIILWDKKDIYIYIGEEIKIQENKELKNKVRK